MTRPWITWAIALAGCTGAHRTGVVPSNSDDFGMLDGNGLVIAPPSGRFDTDADCTPVSALGACEVVPRAGLPDACVCRSEELTIDTLKVTGSRALVLFAGTSVDITTELDISGGVGVDGPGAAASYASAAETLFGAVGGSFQSRGGGVTGPTVDPASVYGEPTLIPLLGGMMGQAGAAVAGGGGGGALQISAGATLAVEGTINAGGGGGAGGGNTFDTSGAGGGGAGGGILLEAPAITITGVVVANGGGGGGGGAGGGSGSDGEDGGTKVANGGDGKDGGGCALYGDALGGEGGSGAFASGDGAAGATPDKITGCTGGIYYVGGGGGGGGVGRIRVNTEDGCQCGGTVLPAATLGGIER